MIGSICGSSDPSRDGVDHLLRRAVANATAACPSLGAKKVSPHMLRCSTTTHLFQAGVDMAVIALWLGYESLETNHVYVEADLATKERALDKLAPIPLGTPARYRLGRAPPLGIIRNSA